MKNRRFYKWEMLGLLCLAFFFHQSDRAIFGVVLPIIKSDLQLSDSQLGLAGSVLFATLALLMPLTGYLGDNMSRKWIITVSVTFWSMATMLTGVARGLVELITFRSVATAGGEAFYAPAAYSLIAQFHKKTRSIAMSLHQGALYIGVMTSGYMGGYIAELWGWRATFYVFGLCGVLLGFILAARLHRTSRVTTLGSSQTDEDRVTFREALAALFRSPTARYLTVGFTAIVFVNNAYVVWAPTLVQDKFDLSLTEAGGGSMLYHHLAALIGVLIGGRISDAFVLRRRSFRLELQSGAMLLGSPAILWVGLAGTPVATWTAMALMGLCRGLYEANTQASLFDVIPARFRASSIAMMVMVAFLLGSLAPWLLGLSREMFNNGNGLSYGFATMSSLYVVGGLAVLLARTTTFPFECRSEEPDE